MHDSCHSVLALAGIIRSTVQHPNRSRSQYRRYKPHFCQLPLWLLSCFCDHVSQKMAPMHQTRAAMFPLKGVKTLQVLANSAVPLKLSLCRKDAERTSGMICISCWAVKGNCGGRPQNLLWPSFQAVKPQFSQNLTLSHPAHTCLFKPASIQTVIFVLPLQSDKCRTICGTCAPFKQ